MYKKLNKKKQSCFNLNNFTQKNKIKKELIPLQKFEAHNDYILKCLISPDLKLLATCSADKTVKIWSFTPEKGYTLNKILYG